MITNNFADKLIIKIREKKNAAVIGLDPRIEMIPDFIKAKYKGKNLKEKIYKVITEFHKIVLDIICDIVPAVKPQIAFFEQYGISGLYAFQETIKQAKKRGLIVIADTKRNDIGTTASAYSNAYLGKSLVFNKKESFFNVDAMTVNVFLGYDTIDPFLNACKEYGKGIFVLVKTSNPGSGDIQNQILKNNNVLYLEIAKKLNKLGMDQIGKEGYSSVGAVVAATYPKIAAKLRRIMRNNYFLVPGYGTQGGTRNDIMNCFNSDGLGAIINASRSITYDGYSAEVIKKELVQAIENNAIIMIKDIS